MPNPVKTLISIALVTVVSMAWSTPSWASETEPKIMAVLFYADWCGSCKALDPQIEKARGKYDLDREDVLFVRLDLTDATTTKQASMLAASLGLADVFEANDGKTGYLLLVDASSGKPVARLMKDKDASAIAQAITARLNA